MRGIIVKTFAKGGVTQQNRKSSWMIPVTNYMPMLDKNDFYAAPLRHRASRRMECLETRHSDSGCRNPGFLEGNPRGQHRRKEVRL